MISRILTTKKHYNWNRFWVPQTGNLVLDKEGYLFDPDSKDAHYYGIDAITLESVQHLPVLILLGEPGIGKSDVLENETERVRALAIAQGDCILSINLAICNSDSWLMRELFDTEEFRSFKNGKNRLYLFLDSLDECKITIPQISTILLNEFRKYPAERLYLRITCRNAVWPAGFENGILQYWNEKSVGIYSLAPLRHCDVKLAAEEAGLDSELFLKEVAQCSAVPFANRPITLLFLLKLFLQNKTLPRSRKELYSLGCKQLCEEQSQSRRDAGFQGKYNLAQRVTIAGRIAATTLLSNRNGVWMGSENEAPDDAVVLYALTNSPVTGDDLPRPIDRGSVEDTCDTGLFKTSETNRIVWAHQTYAEFLAAWYLNQRKLDTGQLIALLGHPGDPEGKIAPQLHEVAAWLSEMNQSWFRRFCYAAMSAPLKVAINRRWLQC